MPWWKLPTVCPGCGRTNEDTTHAEGEPPRDGDASVCWNCGTIGIFERDAEGGMRRGTPQELAVVMASPETQRVVAAIAVAKANRLGPVAAAILAGAEELDAP